MSLSLAQSPSRTFLGHPIMLVPLFLSETWERFSFYGMRALLILYMVQHLKLADAAAFDILGNYLALVYAVPMLGGFMADRVLGYRNAVMIGQILMAAGHLIMTFDGGSTPGPETSQVLFFGLALVAVGNGFMKPNISTLVGRLYEEGDPRRDAGFSLFYMGVNLGAATAAIACGWLAEQFGWSYGFGAAGIGMLIGLAIFSASRSSLPEDALPGGKKARLPVWLVPMVLGLITASWALLQAHAVMGVLLSAGAAGVISLLAYHTMRHATTIQQGRMLAAALLIVAEIVLWFLNEQTSGSLALLADRHIPRDVMGLHVAAASYQSLNPLFIILLAPLLGQIWLMLARRGGDLSTQAKFTLGLILTAASMGLLLLPCMLAAGQTEISPWWLVVSYLVGALGELLISPIGLSAITRLAMPGMVGTMMGLWFLGTAGGDFLAQEVGKLVSVAPSAAGSTSNLAGYVTLFAVLTAIGTISSAVIFLVQPWIGRLIAEPKPVAVPAE
jgi:POT family proton-dependent oligopeptide transporter